eukprot:8310053-Pyramimonas_sp.AAC.1
MMSLHRSSLPQWVTALASVAFLGSKLSSIDRPESIGSLSGQGQRQDNAFSPGDADVSQHRGRGPRRTEESSTRPS